MSKIIDISEPELIGNMPVRTEIEVLPADNPNMTPIGFTCYEVRGGEIWRNGDNAKTPITNRDGLKVGDEIIVPTLMGHFKMTVTEINGNEGDAETEHTMALLEYGIDDRGAWTSDMSFNKKAIKQLTGSL